MDLMLIFKNIIMKRIYNKTLILVSFFAASLISTSCIDNLLNQTPTTEVGGDTFWQTESDAETALIGTYSVIRQLFDRDYYLDGHGEFVHVAAASYNDIYGGKYGPNGYGNSFDKYFKNLYGGVNSTNYVIENINKMLESANEVTRPKLEPVLAEARFLRGLVYFRLISLWGDVPYFDKTITQYEADVLTRTPIAEIYKKIYEDFKYASEKLPKTAVAFGRASQPAALAFKGKLQLYWACWNNFGWPELDTFTPNKEEAKIAYKGAAEDFKKVINDYGLTLFRNGEPGIDEGLGKAETLPNYYYLFIPKTGNNDPEILMSFTHGAYNTDGAKEELQRDFGGRFQNNSQNYVMPKQSLADRYQSTITGDFCEKLILSNDPNIENGAINPESYKNRDFRMKSTILWNYEMIRETKDFVSEGTTDIFHPFVYKKWNAKETINGTQYITYNGSCNTGHVFRKFVRDYEGETLHRSWGDYAWPIMRLADVYLMYAEAVNEAEGVPTEDAIDKVNKVRHRGNLPPLTSDKTSTREEFFNAIEQERIVELVGEGHRGFDIRRWRAMERVWGPPMGNGIEEYDTHGTRIRTVFRNASELDYQRCYIFKIPQSERDRNPNLTQNKPWL